TSGQHTTSKGVSIPVGQSKTITVRLFSHAPTSNWSVSALDFSSAGNNLQFTWDAQTGNNGTVLHLTIKVLQKDTDFNGEPFLIVSTQNGKSNYWPVIVTN